MEALPPCAPSMGNKNSEEGEHTMTEARRRPTLDDVARTAGVSRSVASRAVNGADRVSSTARDAVDAAIRELGYVPNLSARTLASARAGAIMLAISQDDPGALADPFFAHVIVGINEALESTDLALTLMLADSPRGKERLERVLHSQRVDGILLLALHGDDPLYRLARRLDIPVVTGGRPLTGEPGWFVDVDNVAGARSAVDHLIASGRKRIATITGRLDTHVGKARQQGYSEAMTLAGLEPTRIAVGDFTQESGFSAMTALLTEHPDLDAVFAQSDSMAAGAVEALDRSGRRVPADVAVVGFDDLPIATTTRPALTTVHQPVDALGREMTKTLITLLEGGRPTSMILPTHLVVRETAP